MNEFYHYNNLKKYLEDNYKEYFKYLDLETQLKYIQSHGIQEEKIQQLLDENLENYIDCKRILAENKGLECHKDYKREYENLLKELRSMKI